MSRSSVRSNIVRSVLVAVTATVTCLVMPQEVAHPEVDAAAGALVVTLDNDGGTTASGEPVTYRAVVKNAGRQDLAGIRVTLNFDAWFRISEAIGGRIARPAVAVWHTTLPAGKDVAFTVNGAFTTIPADVHAARATGCVFVPGRLSPLACNSEVDSVADASASSDLLVLLWSIVVVFAVLACVAFLIFRRRRRDVSAECEAAEGSAGAVPGNGC